MALKARSPKPVSPGWKRRCWQDHHIPWSFWEKNWSLVFQMLEAAARGRPPSSRPAAQHLPVCLGPIFSGALYLHFLSHPWCLYVLSAFQPPLLMRTYSSWVSTTVRIYKIL